MRRFTFQEKAESDVANALRRHAPQRPLGHIGTGADVEESQVVDRVAGQRGIERLSFFTARRRRAYVVDRAHPLLPGRQALAGIALHAESAVDDAGRDHRRLRWQQQAFSFCQNAVWGHEGGGVVIVRGCSWSAIFIEKHAFKRHDGPCALLPAVVVESALLHNPNSGRGSPYPRRSYATRTVSGVPRLVNLLRIDARTCSSVTCLWKSRAITRSPSLLKHPILVSTKLRR